ncbi:MAG TPA: efflux RND transporter periplasmic adaptor subunit, partial [Allocoleopsis sp.]
ISNKAKLDKRCVFFKASEMNINAFSQMFVVILALSIAGACNSQPQEIKVRLSPVEEATIVESSEYVAILESLCSPTLKPPMNGQVNKILVELGDRVVAKTPLIQLIPTQQTSSDQFFISAPCTGIISNILVNEGESVSTSTPLITLVQNQPLEVNLAIPLEQADQVKRGMPIELRTSQNQSLARSEVISISPQVRDVEQSILVKAHFDNAGGQLRPGQLVRAKLVWDSHPGILVPTSAVIRVGGQTLVYVAQSQKSQLIAQARKVKLGKIQDEQYEVISGLQPGEKLIVSGVLNLTDGATITSE